MRLSRRSKSSSKSAPSSPRADLDKLLALVASLAARAFETTLSPSEYMQLVESTHLLCVSNTNSNSPRPVISDNDNAHQLVETLLNVCVARTDHPTYDAVVGVLSRACGYLDRFYLPECNTRPPRRPYVYGDPKRELKPFGEEKEAVDLKAILMKIKG